MYKSDSECLKKAAEDEPIFVLRAQDVTSPLLILQWICLNSGISEEKRNDAMAVAQAMFKYKLRKSAD